MGRLKLKNSKPANEQEAPLTANDRLAIPATWLPSARTHMAIQRGVERNLLFNTWGGLGDQACAEPAIRYAMKHFKDCTFSLASEKPELFQHLKFERVFDLNKEQPIWDKYFMFRTIHNVDHIQWEFMSHMLIQAVDYVSLCMFRLQMPIADRAIEFQPSDPQDHIAAQWMEVPNVVVHPGRHWQSKTFPAWFWNQVIEEIKSEGALPILVGAETDDNRGTVNVDARGCLDLRGQTNLNDFMWVLKKADVLLTNDSSPLHIAASGKAWIGFIATCKHPDYITHYRRTGNGVSWGWRMRNFGRGGIWDYQNYCPNVAQVVEVDKVDPKILESWLPDPKAYATWAINKSFEEYSLRHDL